MDARITGMDDRLTLPTIAKHGGLFVLTLLTTSIAGLMWQMELDLAHLGKGLAFSIPLMLILTAHEFGHYFAARRHGVKVTLPYFIPIPPFASFLTIGTFGAFIRVLQPYPNRRALFDIGVAGPIAGFVVSLFVLAYGFMTLPGPDFILSMHPDFDFALGSSPSIPDGQSLVFGSSLLYQTFESLFSPSGAWIPPMTEMYHYPFLMAGWVGMLVTALNLLPASQFDGGHLAYVFLRSRYGIVSRIVGVGLTVLGALSWLPDLFFLIGRPDQATSLLMTFHPWGGWFWSGWLLWGIMILFIFKPDHPEVFDNQTIGPGRTVVALLALLIFVLSFMPSPIYFM